MTKARRNGPLFSLLPSSPPSEGSGLEGKASPWSNKLRVSIRKAIISRVQQGRRKIKKARRGGRGKNGELSVSEGGGGTLVEPFATDNHGKVQIKAM